MILLNAMQRSESVSRTTAKAFLQLLAPFAPHVAEELWHLLGETSSIVNTQWPTFDPSVLKHETVTVPVQINGKVRGEVKVPANTPREEIVNRAKELSKIIPFIASRRIVREIYVPNKILNFVVH
jgi:leucyl-tRNA synthetase